jgi:phage FluMu protein Com
MYRKTRCTNCNYTLEDSVSYYLHAKAWKAGHDLKACLEIRKAKNAFDEMFAETTTALSNLTIIK